MSIPKEIEPSKIAKTKAEATSKFYGNAAHRPPTLQFFKCLLLVKWGVKVPRRVSTP